MTRTKLALAAFVAGAFATVGLGQNADKNSAGPTKNDYRLRIVQPVEGSTVTGSTVQVAVNTEIPADVGEEKRDVNSMPRPDVDVFLDNSLKGTMRDAENVLDIENVSPGTHTIVLLAKNRANEIIDRKEIHFSSINEAGIASKSGPADTTSPAAVSAPAPAPMSTEPTTYRAPAPPPSEPAHSAATSTYSSSSSSSASTSSESSAADASNTRRLPATASSDPALAVAGAGLLLAAFGLHFMSRRRRAA